MTGESWFSDDIDDRYRYARSKSSNNNYNMIKRRGIGIVDFHEDDDEDEENPRFCPHCENFDMKNKLGAKMIPYGEEPQPDHDLWMSCYVCGNTFPKHEIEKQKELKVAELKDHVTDNPFDANKSIVTGIPKRSSPQGKKASAKRKRERDRPHHKDKEIDEEMRRHGDRVTVLEDTDP